MSDELSKRSGSCNCGAVRYEVTSKILNVVNCHCRLCRKMNGASFSTYVVVAESGFTQLDGDLTTCNVTDKSRKSFCSKCGTPIYNENPKYDGLKILYFGSLDDTSDLAPKANIYCESEVDWLCKVVELPRFGQGLQ